MTWSSPAVAKGGSSWQLSDSDGFVQSGQRVTARVAFLDHKPYPSEAWLVPWDWDHQPRRVPEERIFLGGLEFEKTRAQGQRFVTTEIIFVAPERPDDYAIVTCVVPCRDIAAAPGPTSLRVVADAVEERLRKEFAARDARYTQLEYRFHKSKARVGELEERLGDQLRYLSDHGSRLVALEKEIGRNEPPAMKVDLLALGGVGLAGAALGFAAARRSRISR